MWNVNHSLKEKCDIVFFHNKEQKYAFAERDSWQVALNHVTRVCNQVSIDIPVCDQGFIPAFQRCNNAKNSDRNQFQIW